MAKVEVLTMPKRRKQIPLAMAVADNIIRELRFVEVINESVSWDRSHWNISPGGLAKMLVLGTFTDIRIPLTHLENRFEGIDAEYFLDPMDKSSFVNESNMGEALDRIGETAYDSLYETVALTAVRKYNMQIKKMHSDTTTISFYGDYDIEDLDLTADEEEALLHIEKGYNKDGRPGCKQVVVGQIVTEDGIPIVSKTLDGSTSDIEWNREAIKYAKRLASEGFIHGIYVADSKLVIQEFIEDMNDPEKRLQFVSRCPANFCNSLERRTIARAYRSGQWCNIGSITDAKGAAQYRGISFVEDVYGTPTRLLVLESDALLRKAESAVEKKEAQLVPLVKLLEKGQWLCLADAEAERERFLSTKELSLFDCNVHIVKHVEEKWPKGRRGPNTTPTVKETFHLRVEGLSRSETACRDFLQRESCFVLISNVTDGVSDKDLLKIYKGQHVVENSFRALKSPQLASVIYLKSPTRINVLSMLLTFSLLLRALIQYELREGLKAFKEKNPGKKLKAGWGGRPLEAPTFKLLYEHSVNCYYERISSDRYTFEWSTLDTRNRIEPLLMLMGLSVETLLK